MAIASGQKVVSYAPMDNIVGIILAGGKSSRMGTDKAGLIYQNRSLLEHAQHLLNEAGVSEIYISGSSGIEDIIPNRGPLGGIHSVTQKLTENQEVVILPIDMPLLSKDLLISLVQKECLGDAIHFERFIMPLRLKLSRNVTKYIEEVVTENSDVLSIKSLLDILKVETIDPTTGGEHCFINTNTPNEWKKVTADYKPIELPTLSATHENIL